mgnify:CR=1 FL=1
MTEEYSIGVYTIPILGCVSVVGRIFSKPVIHYFKDDAQLDMLPYPDSVKLLTRYQLSQLDLSQEWGYGRLNVAENWSQFAYSPEPWSVPLYTAEVTFGIDWGLSTSDSIFCTRYVTTE